MEEVEIGRVNDFFAQPVVAGIELTGKIKKGDTIHIKGHTTDLTFTASSIQVDHAEVAEANPGDAIGIKTPDRVRHGDTVYKVTS
jgi:translation elongation factor EF-1alpha